MKKKAGESAGPIYERGRAAHQEFSRLPMATPGLNKSREQQ